MNNFSRTIIILIVFITIASAQSIVGTPHDFSDAGWAHGELCRVCHTPHNAISNAQPLWNHEITTAEFIPYENTQTMNAVTGAPTGSSKLCLSCHDGTVAIDNYSGRSNTQITISSSYEIGTDLSDDHPVSFTYDAALATNDGELHDPTTTNSSLGGTIASDMLSGGNTVECTSCHDVHNNMYGNFLLKNNSSSALCLTCHDK